MPLTDVSIRKAKHGPKPIKLADARGLFLLLQPSGTKLWRLKYRFASKEKKLSLGMYPDVSLKDARLRCDEARLKIAGGVDPGQEKRIAAAAQLISAGNSFKAVADEYIDKCQREGRADVTIDKSKWLLSLMEHDLGTRPIAEIRPAEVLATLRKIEKKGNLETARRMRSLAGRVFRYAISTARAETDPTIHLRGALTIPKVQHRSAILQPAALGSLLLAIDGYHGHPLTCLALQLTPHLFVRPGELRSAEWSEFEFDRAVWMIPAAKMKMRAPHLVPLSRQALELLREAQILSGRQQYVFSTLYPGKRPMSENTINNALRRLGYDGTEMTAHGFRASASTLLNEAGIWNPDAIERALAHKDANSIRSAYHRGEHWDERVRMAQWWSDHLDALRAKAAGKPIAVAA